MSRLLIFIFTCVILASTASIGWSAPSFRGYTGLVVVPTADTLDEGEFNLGLMTEGIDDFDANDMFMNYGPNDGLEIGFNSFQPLNGDDRETLLNAKYRLMPETEDRAGVAFGLIDATDEIQSTAYAVASKSLARGLSVFDNDVTNLRGHIGIGGGRLDGLFVGLSAFAGNRAMFSIEYDSKDTNIGFRFTPVRGVRLHAGWFDVGGGDDFGAGVSFSRNY